MASNGDFPRSALGTIPGSSPRPGGLPLLRKDAARAYTALHAYAMDRWGISMALAEGDIRRAYRERSAQEAARRMWCAQGKCGNAAVPGTSNHGWALAVDLMTAAQRWVIDQVGHLFGFSKSWSDAAHEWWHIVYRPGNYPMVAKWSLPPVLKKGSRGKRVALVQARLHDVLPDADTRKVPKKGEKGRGYYGKHTRKAVKKFQRKQGMTADGQVGPKTWEALKRASKKH